ncbi:Uncharacterised protein [Streptococcus pneumoniae]|uniref:hypothetical protein n=1 Tax=Streptococcus pneumoniae TaxID=1313 RepID=UPI0005E92F56|nr:hypothetical protein [Streptococcus pneumoniae]CAG7568819.1 Uncharacterised protein [Streptococcus pneumoniae]CEV40775.1 Uncharacterised protein [Streptococcus pneumoniae]CEV84668.1 Uncharacterised protein [Streptococcus pneumoniae]CEY70528.1 Uncharacterised protein [Streptococcus pneumoniae]CGG49639.1 Uncharacterised protein [Streptococcus pneumoniae]
MITLNNNHTYTAETIERILGNYSAIKWGSFTNEALQVVKRDIDRALMSDKLTGTMRKVLAVTYALELNLIQGKKLTGLSLTDFKEAKSDALEVLEACLNGMHYKELKASCAQARGLKQYIEHIEKGIINIFDVSADTQHDVITLLASAGDTLAKTTLGEHIEDVREATMYAEKEDENPHNFYHTSLDVESPSRNRDFKYMRKHFGYDYFKDRDKNHKVTYPKEACTLDEVRRTYGNRKGRASIC